MNSWHDKMFLIVEDDNINFKLLEMVLKPTGAIILRAENGNEAVQLVKDSPGIDVILMDLQLPEKDGFEATREIKTICKTPVIAITANAISDERKKCFDVGCSEFLTKPVSRALLFKTLERFLVNNYVES